MVICDVTIFFVWVYKKLRQLSIRSGSFIAGGLVTQNGRWKRLLSIKQFEYITPGAICQCLGTFTICKHPKQLWNTCFWPRLRQSTCKHVNQIEFWVLILHRSQNVLNIIWKCKYNFHFKIYILKRTDWQTTQSLNKWV